MAEIREKRRVLRAMRVEIDATAAITLSRLARFSGSSLNLIAGEILNRIAKRVARYQEQYDVLGVDDTSDMPAGLAAAVDGLNDLVCEAAFMEGILPAEFLRLEKTCERLSQLSILEDARVAERLEIEVPVIWTPEDLA